MSYISHFRRQLRLLGISALAAVSSIAPAQVPAKKPDVDEDKDGTVRPFADNEVLGSEDWKLQGKYIDVLHMDDHMHRYGKLEEMVQRDPDDGGFFWVQVRFFRESDSAITLRGMRNDGREFFVRGNVDGSEIKSFDGLCNELDGQLKLRGSLNA